MIGVLIFIITDSINKDRIDSKSDLHEILIDQKMLEHKIWFDNQMTRLDALETKADYRHALMQIQLDRLDITFKANAELSSSLATHFEQLEASQ